MYFEHEYIVKVKGNSDKAKNLYYEVENEALKNGFF